MRRHSLFFVVLALALGLRVAVQVAYPHAFFFNDSLGYVRQSELWQPGQFHPPGYAVLLKPLVPGPLYRVALLQHLLGLGLVVAGYVFLIRRGVRPWIAALAVTPVAIDGLELDLEHFVAAETLFTVLVGAALLVLTWRQKVPAVSAAVAGLLLAGAVLTRTIGQPLLVLALCYLVGLMLAGRTKWWSVAAFVLAAVAPLTAYVVWFHHVFGVYSFDQISGRALYSRVMTIADCHKLDLTASQSLLCVPQPPSQRPDVPDYWGWSGDSPGKKYFPSFTDDPFLREFGLTVIRQQPVDYLRMVAEETFWHFRPEAPLSTSTHCRFGGWQLPARPNTACNAAFYSDTPTPADAPKIVPQPETPLRAVLADYSASASAARGPVLGFAMLVALAPLVWRPRRRAVGGWRDGADALLFATAGFGLLVASVAFGMYEPRYAVSSVFLIPIGAAAATRHLARRSAVVVDQEPVADRTGLAGEDVPGGQLVGLQGPVGRHPHLTLDEPGAAGGADPTLAGVRELGADSQRGVQDPLVPAHDEGGGPPVEPDRHLGNVTAD
jgi:hypothetical protein